MAKLVVGLGNPGTKYKRTRHNAGFIALDHLAEILHLSWKTWSNNKNCQVIETSISNEKVVLAKPLTYMNLSGEAVDPLSAYYNIAPEDICVVHDEVDLSMGTVRLKVGGGTGGHNGLKSIEEHLGSKEFRRIRMGVGKSDNDQVSTADHVLGAFTADEKELLDDMVSRTLKGIDAFISGPETFKRAMDTLNQKQKPEESEQ